MAVCQVCQKNNPAGAEYCEDCGAALTATGVPTTVGAGVGVSSVNSAASASPLPPAQSLPTVPPSSSSSSAAASPEAGSSKAFTPTDAPSTVQSAAPTPPPAPTAAGAAAKAKLQAIRYGAPFGDEIPLFGQRLSVGRFDPETGPVDIDLSAFDEGGHVSRQHGEISHEADGSWLVRDLGSTNGVFVKSGAATSFGPRISAPHPLADGDELAFGNARFIFKTS
jgi:hypothetical protein